jgi:hypothetical protein
MPNYCQSSSGFRYSQRLATSIPFDSEFMAKLVVALGEGWRRLKTTLQNSIPRSASSLEVNAILVSILVYAFWDTAVSGSRWQTWGLLYVILSQTYSCVRWCWNHDMPSIGAGKRGHWILRFSLIPWYGRKEPECILSFPKKLTLRHCLRSFIFVLTVTKCQFISKKAKRYAQNKVSLFRPALSLSLLYRAWFATSIRNVCCEFYPEYNDSSL